MTSAKQNGLKHVALGAVVGWALWWAGPAAKAEDAAASSSDPIVGKIALNAGVDVVTEYFFRGLLQEDSGVIAQPWAEFVVNLCDGCEYCDGLDLTVGLWHSLHDNHTGASGDGPKLWYETDFYTALTLYKELWAFDVGYVAYTSPNGAFAESQEVSVGVSYDDSACWPGANDVCETFTGLQPAIFVAFETKGGSDLGDDQGIYFQVSLAPGATLIDSEDWLVNLTIPMTVGLSLDNYYEDSAGKNHHFGFFDIGGELSMPLTCIPAEYGDWTFAVGVHYMFLAYTNAEVNDGDDPENAIIGKLSLSMSY